MPSYNWLILRIHSRIPSELPYYGKVIDLGCGTAPIRKRILDEAEIYMGIDWGKSIHNKSNVDVIADLNLTFPVKSDSADIVSGFQVLEHIREPFLFLEECHRILKNGGKLYMTIPFMWHIHEEPYDYYRYTKYGLQYMLEKYDFYDISILENTGFWITWFLKFNYHTIKYGRGIFKLIMVPVWQLTQVLAIVLDKIDKNFKECTSYTVIAKK